MKPKRKAAFRLTKVIRDVNSVRRTHRFASHRIAVRSFVARREISSDALQVSIPEKPDGLMVCFGFFACYPGLGSSRSAVMSGRFGCRSVCLLVCLPSRLGRRLWGAALISNPGANFHTQWRSNRAWSTEGCGE